MAHFSPSCKTLTRAREIPIAGAKFRPTAVRSEEFPLGLKSLSTQWMASMKARLETDNVLAEWAVRMAVLRHTAGLGFILENPWNSYLWLFPSALALAALDGVFDIRVDNCMFATGSKFKKSRFRTNIAGLRLLIGRRCSGRQICDRTGVQHDSWRPTVDGRKVTQFPSEMEAEFQRELCELLA